MKPYDVHASADPFARSISAFESRTAALSGQTATSWTHAELEEHLEAAGRTLLRQLLQDHLDLRARREEEAVRAGAHPPVIGPDGRLRPWREAGHARWLACLFGLVRVERIAYRGPGAANVHPADEAQPGEFSGDLTCHRMKINSHPAYTTTRSGPQPELVNNASAAEA